MEAIIGLVAGGLVGLVAFAIYCRVSTAMERKKAEKLKNHSERSERK